MAWADTLTRGKAMGRGIVIRGRWAKPGEAPEHPPRPKTGIPVPIEFPGFVLSVPSLRAFNTAFFHQHRPRHRSRIQHPQPFFYPLDTFLNWNRIYGPRGLVQYQCVLPADEDPDCVERFFETLTARRGASFLTVIKDCGPEGKGMLSFPKRGISVALDLPRRPDRTQALVDALNEIVIAAGGRIYLTKDALTRPEHLRAMEPRLNAWLEVRRKWDPEGRLRSAQSVRLLGDSP